MRISRFFALPALVLSCAFALQACASDVTSSPSSRVADSPLQSGRSTHPTEPLRSTLVPAVEIRNGPNPGALELVVQGTVELDSQLIVEQQLSDSSFQPVRNLDGGSMKLVTSCKQPMRACVKVDQRGLRPIAWTGMTCAAQCNGNCDKNLELYGHFRFVVRSCDGKTRYEGPVFELLEPK